MDMTAIVEPPASLSSFSAVGTPFILVLVPRLWIINSLYLCYYVTYLALNFIPLWY